MSDQNDGFVTCGDVRQAEGKPEWFFVVIMDGATYGIRSHGDGMSFPWSADRADTHSLCRALNEAVDFMFKHPPTFTKDSDNARQALQGEA